MRKTETNVIYRCWRWTRLKHFKNEIHLKLKSFFTFCDYFKHSIIIVYVGFNVAILVFISFHLILKLCTVECEFGSPCQPWNFFWKSQRHRSKIQLNKKHFQLKFFTRQNVINSRNLFAKRASFGLAAVITFIFDEKGINIFANISNLRGFLDRRWFKFMMNQNWKSELK